MIPERLATALADRYRIERELGQGGMATVYLAHDLKHDRQVAIKVLRPELAAAIGAERFLSEIKTTANLQHPHILPLFDSGIADSFLFYVMPFVEGESLRDRLNREKQLPIGDAVRIATEVASALDYAHRHNVIHRDIKPENILLHDGRALVADFGIALAASKAGGARMTETGMSLGTPTYMSPEQAMGEREITARSDVYALGCVLYEMLVGEPPFTGPTAQAIVAKVMTAEPTALHQLRKTVPAVVEEATLRALEKLPADRYATAAEFATALTQSPTGVFPRAKGTRRLDWRVALAGVLLGVVLGVTYMVLRGSAPGAGAAERRQQLTFNGRSTQPAISPDGAWVAYNDVSCRHGSSDLCSATLLVQEVGSTQAVPIIRDALSLSAARWSHDGSQLVIAGQLDAVRSGLFVIPRTGGVARLTGPAGAFDTHPSGDTVVVVRSNPGNTATALFINLSSGAVADSVAFPVTDPLDIAWSPDGRHIAANAARYQLAVISREGKEEGRLTFTARQSIRWNVAGDAILTFTVGAVKEDEFIRVPVDRDGGLTSPPSVVVARVPTLYAGLFDVARRTGRIVLATGDAITDLYTFSLTPGNAGEQQRTRGTTWYGTPSFSPDGSTLYYGRGDALGDNVYALTLKDGAEEALTAQELPFGSAVRVSVDGHRLSFGHALPNGRRMDVLELPSRRILSQMAGGSASVVWPLGERGYLDGSGDRRTLQVLDSLGGAWRSLVAPDSMSIDNFAPSPDGRRAAVMVTTAHATLLGTVSLAEWEFHVIARWPFKAEGRGDTPTEGPGAVSGTSISWESNRSIYFTAWPRADEVPSLWRIDESGGTPARVVNVPSVCEPRSISLNLATRLGSCVSGDYRRDIWIMEGVEGR